MISTSLSLYRNFARYFSYEQTIYSAVAEKNKLNNNPPPDVSEALRYSAESMDVVQDLVRRPIRILRWYLSPEVCAFMNDPIWDIHSKGESIDFVCPSFGSPYVLAKYLSMNTVVLRFDVLLLERKWVHLTFPINPKRHPRSRIYTLLSSGVYVPGIVQETT